VRLCINSKQIYLVIWCKLAMLWCCGGKKCGVCGNTPKELNPALMRTLFRFLLHSIHQELTGVKVPSRALAQTTGFTGTQGGSWFADTHVKTLFGETIDGLSDDRVLYNNKERQPEEKNNRTRGECRGKVHGNGEHHSGIDTYLLLLLHEILQLLLTGRQGKREGRGRRKKEEGSKKRE
jgi:hypothetical protein